MLGPERKIFYTLIKAGIGHIVEEIPPQFNVNTVLYYISSQGLICLACEGISNICEKYGKDAVIRELKIKLYYLSDNIIQSNSKKKSIYSEFAERLYPLRCIVLKGMDYAQYWPNSLYRESGDMDVIVVDDEGHLAFEEGNKKAANIGATGDRGTYKHSHLYYRGLMIENHQFITNFEGTKRGKSIERTLQSLLFKSQPVTIPDTSLFSPNVNFTAIFLLKHAQHHFLFEGIAIRHILDWLFFIEAEGSKIDWQWFYKTVENMRLRVFADVIFAFCEQKLDWHFSNLEIHRGADYGILETVEEYIFTPKANVLNRNPFYIAKRFVKRFYRIWTFRKLHYQSLGRAIWTSIAYASVLDRHPTL